jgi:hypothetical protein
VSNYGTWRTRPASAALPAAALCSAPDPSRPHRAPHDALPSPPIPPQNKTPNRQLARFRASNEANEREQEGYAAKQAQLEAQIQQARARHIRFVWVFGARATWFRAVERGAGSRV